MVPHISSRSAPLRRADLGSGVSPFAYYNVAVQLLFFLSSNGASPAERVSFSVLRNRNRRATAFFPASVPGHFVHLIQIDAAVFTFVFFGSSTHTDNACLITRVL